MKAILAKGKPIVILDQDTTGVDVVPRDTAPSELPGPSVTPHKIEPRLPGKAPAQ